MFSSEAVAELCIRLQASDEAQEEKLIQATTQAILPPGFRTNEPNGSALRCLCEALIKGAQWRVLGFEDEGLPSILI